MTSRPESSSGWSFSGGGSIWQGGHSTGRGLFDHHDDPSWRRWHSVSEQRPEKRPPSPPPPLLTFLPRDTDPSLANTLYMGDLEPWMDHEYASQVVHLMGWDQPSNSNGVQNGPVTIKIPPPPPDLLPQPNNPGYCLITFPTPAQAANVLASLHSVNANKSSASPLLMPNSSRPFNLQWASSAQLPTATATAFVGQTQAGLNGIPGVAHATMVPANQSLQREYSIFVGDLAPETSNSDLVAVFRNPVLGLRNDREPKFIRPFYSCKSAKIMLDPVTGVSRGYGFVRFTDEGDQQRALIEMHGLYCLSRPMRVSPATAKFKPNPSATMGSAFPPPVHPSPVKLTFPVPAVVPQAPDHEDERGGGGSNDKSSSGIVRSVSSPVAAASTSTTPSIATSTANSGSPNESSAPAPVTANGKHSANAASPPPRRSSRTPGSDQAVQGQGDLQNMPHILAQIAQLASANGTPVDWNSAPSNPSRPGSSNKQVTGQNGGALGSYPSASSITSQPPPYPGQAAMFGMNANGINAAAGGPNISMGGEAGGVYDEAWTHQAQARAMLGNLIGPNGEQLTSTDPYNTTVFVGGLSPLISEETLRTFFAPFGDIHYVKVPLGKHCGFVQFVRKADAERAIERMQGFPIGGSRIRLSWGRSQYKAAQAAAQAAQAAQAEQVARMTATAVATAATNPQNPTSLHITPEQALLLLQSLGYNSPAATVATSSTGNPLAFAGTGPPASFANGNMPHTDVSKGFANADSDNAYGSSSDTQQQQSEFAPFSSVTNTHLSFNGQEEQSHSLMTPSPSQPLPHPSQSYAPGFGPSPSSISGKYSDTTNSPHSSSTESSSGSSSVRFSGLGSSGFPSSAFLDNPSAAFDILRHDSQTLLPRMSTSVSHPQLPSQSHSQEQPTTGSPPRHQQQSQAQGLRDDSPSEILHDLNGTLASLNLGESYTRGAIGSEMLTKDGYPHGGERRTLPVSMSAPLRNFSSPRPKSGGSHEST